MDRFPRSDSIVQPRAGLQTYMAQVYGWMTVGLLLTAFVAWYAANSAAVMELLFTNRVFLIGLIIAQLALVIVLSAMIQKLSAGVTTMLFMLYSALTGLTLSSIFIVYTAALYRQYFRRYCRDVRRNEPVRLHHEARFKWLWQYAVYGVNRHCAGIAGQLLVEKRSIDVGSYLHRRDCLCRIDGV